MKFVVLFAFLALSVCAKLKDDIEPISFVPGELPCKYGFVATVNSTQDMNGTKTEDIKEIRVYYDGGMIYSLTTEGQMLTMTSARRDLGLCSNVPVYAGARDGASGNSNCFLSTQTESEVEAVYKGNFTYLFEEQLFLNVTDSEYKGKPCKYYYAEQEAFGANISWAIYATGNNRVLAFWHKTVTSVSMSETMNALEYIDDFELSEFAVDKNLFSNCAEEAYTVPDDDQCGYFSSASPMPCSSSSSGSSNSFPSDSSSSSSSSSEPPSAASTIQVAIALVIAAIATAFVALF